MQGHNQHPPQPGKEGESSCPTGEMGDGCAHGGRLTIFRCCFRCCRLCSDSWGRTWAATEVPRAFPPQLPHPAGTLGTGPSCQHPPASPLGGDAPLQAVPGVTQPLWGHQTAGQCPTPHPSTGKVTGVPSPPPPCPCQSPTLGLPGKGAYLSRWGTLPLLLPRCQLLSRRARSLQSQTERQSQVRHWP